MCLILYVAAASVKMQMWGDVARNFVAPYDESYILFREELSWTVMIAIGDSSGDRTLRKRVAHTVELLGDRKLLPLQHAVHMSVYMDIAKIASEQGFNCLQTASDVCALCTWTNSSSVMRGYFEGALVVAAQ